MKPITPSEAEKRRKSVIPEAVFESFNECIVARLVNGRALVLQKDVVAKICSKMEIDSQNIYDNHWLDVEELYEEAGWKVTYDKPRYCENYEASFLFEVK